MACGCAAIGLPAASSAGAAKVVRDVRTSSAGRTPERGSEARPRVQASVTVSARRARAISSAISGPPKITCTLSIDNPHRSTHNPDVINVVANWKCTSAVKTLTMSVKLFSASGIELSRTPWKSIGKARLKGHTNYPCYFSSDYYGEAPGTVYFPAGYKPHKSNLKVDSPTVGVVCP